MLAAGTRLVYAIIQTWIHFGYNIIRNATWMISKSCYFVTQIECTVCRSLSWDFNIKSKCMYIRVGSNRGLGTNAAVNVKRRRYMNLFLRLK